MEQHLKQFDALIEKADAYAKTSVELIKLKTIDKVADGTSSFVAWSAFIIAAILFFITINFGIALWLGDLMGKIYYGFFVVAGFYAIVGLILFIFRNKWIKKPLNDSMVNEMMK
jgi:hypothetical protein